MKLRSLVLGALALLASLVAPSPVGAGPTAPSVVAVLANGDFVDVEEETANLLDDLEAGGHIVVEFTDISVEGLIEALDGADVLVIPELERGGSNSLSDALGADGRALLADWVDAGGRILFFGSSDPTPVINATFGFSTEDVEPGCGGSDDEWVEGLPPCSLTSSAGATEFADGPATLAYVNDTTGLVVDSLPTGSTVVYQFEFDDAEEQEEDPTIVAAAIVQVAGAATMPFGDGVVVFLGWDWYPDADYLLPAAAEDEAQWATVLDLAVSQPAVAATGAAGSVTFTSDSPSTQPIFVSYTIGDATEVATIAPGTTSVTVELDGPASVTWSVAGWGVGAGTAEVAAVVVTPTPAPTPAPAQPVVAQPSFTG